MPQSLAAAQPAPIDAAAAHRRVLLALWASGESVWEWRASTDRISVDRYESDPDTTNLPAEAMPPQLLADQLTVDQFFASAHPEDQATLRMAWRLHLRGVHPDVDVSFRLDEAGTTRWLRLRGKALGRDAQGRVQQVLGTLKDVSAQRDAEESLRLMAHAFASTRDAMVVVDSQWQVLELNDATRRLCSDTDLAPGADLQRWIGEASSVLDVVLFDSIWRGERSLSTPGGAVPVELSVTAVVASDGDRHCFLVSLHDLRERRLVEARLQRLANVDTLTGLPNRQAAQWQVEVLLAQPQGGLGLMFINLDGFKEINDSYGHEQGDALLIAVAERLRAALPEDAFLARWASDEFAVLLAGDGDDTAVRSAAQVVLAALAQPFAMLDGHDLGITPSLGAALAPQDGQDFNTLVRRADLALHAAKERGRNGLAFFEPALDSDVQRRVRMTSLLRVDTDRNGFRFVAQPKVDAQGRPVGAELLMRWTTEAFGIVSPVEFIPLAEKVGLIQLMGRHAAHAAAQLAAQCLALGHRLPVAVNLSYKQLREPGLANLLLLACRRHGIEPDLLELEMTESALAHDFDAETLAPVLHRLKSLGFSLALDDFGTGHSSLSFLRLMPFDKVKIDRSFVLDADSDPAAAALLRSIVQMCETLDMRVVAEGVETAAQARMLADMGVHEFQGYHFARPVPVDDWLGLLRGHPGTLPQLPLS